MRSYPLAAGCWPGSDMIQIYDINNNRLCTIPIAFLQASDDLNWHFVSDCIRACVESEGILVSGDNAEGTAVDFESAVVPGKYFFQRQGELIRFRMQTKAKGFPQDDMVRPISLRRGPIGRKRGRAPLSGTDESETTRSSLRSVSSRYGNDQVSSSHNSRLSNSLFYPYDT